MNKNNSKPHILLLEPYYGGSHKAFLQGLQIHLDFEFDFSLISMLPRKWKMRMQLAAPWMAEQIVDRVRAGQVFDLILTSTFLDLAVLRSRLAMAGIFIPVAVYFHENQFNYPFQPQDVGQYQFSAINFTSALCADAIAFNSVYNRDTFFDGVRNYLKKSTDMDVQHMEGLILEKSTVVYPGIDYHHIDGGETLQGKKKVPVIVWNHRWEHDKDPESFFAAVQELAEEKRAFKLIVLGEQFQRQPPVFTAMEQKLAPCILQFGYARDRDQYARFLRQGTIVVSTAIHEFFGMAILEGVRAGCRPLVPDRLAYRELFPVQYRYGDGDLKKGLLQAMVEEKELSVEERLRLTDKYSWPLIADEYVQWLGSVAGDGDND